jgi:hypothetical protein
MTGAATGGVRVLLRVEGACVLAAGFGFTHLGRIGREAQLDALRRSSA